MTSGMDVFVHTYWGNRRTLQATIVTIFSHMTRDISDFVKCDTIFVLFFLKFPQFHTSKFRKVVRQHIEGVVGSIICVLLEIYLASQQWKNFENPLRIDKVIAMSLVYYFFGTVYIRFRLWLQLVIKFQRQVRFLSASLYVSKRGAYWDRLCRDVVGRWWLVGWLSRACTVAKRCILGL